MTYISELVSSNTWKYVEDMDDVTTRRGGEGKTPNVPIRRGNARHGRRKKNPFPREGGAVGEGGNATPQNL